MNRKQITETALTPKELAKHSGKYLSILIQFIGSRLPVPVDPPYRATFGDSIQLDPAMGPALEKVFNSGDILGNLPAKATAIIDGEKKSIPWGVLFKGREFTSLTGQKSYNAGHLAELIMGIGIAAKFVNKGADITNADFQTMFTKLIKGPTAKNYEFTYAGTITWPEASSKNDQMSFRAVIPTKSAEEFVRQATSGQYSSDLAALISSAVKYVNESQGVQKACDRVRLDKNSNRIDVVSDGSSDAKGTKADLQLSVDGTKVNLLSLKTYSTETLGQISGIKYEALSKWFDVAFGIDISRFEKILDPTLGAEKVYQNLLTKVYDDYVHPKVKKLIEDQTPGKEAEIVKKLASAARYHARGEGMESVEIVKLDDSVATGNYKILQFSDDLEEAMTHLDLDVRYIGKGQGRTIQIWVKPEPDEKVARGANRLCQFRTQKMGDSYRNYYEIGPMMEMLVQVEQPLTARTPNVVTGRPVDIRPPGTPERARQKRTDVGRERR